MTEETGGTLREKLEAALAANRELAEKVRASEMRDIASEFTLVKPEDLEGVDLDTLRDRATEIQEKRAAEQRELLGKAGLTEEQVEAVMDGETVTTGDLVEDGLTRMREVGASGGKVPDAIPENSYTGYDAIRAHFAKQSK